MKLYIKNNYLIADDKEFPLLDVRYLQSDNIEFLVYNIHNQKDNIRITFFDIEKGLWTNETGTAFTKTTMREFLQSNTGKGANDGINALISDTSANFTANNPVLLTGQIGYETDTKKEKIGDGVTAWNDLEYKLGVIEINTAIYIGKDSSNNDNGNSYNVALGYQALSESTGSENVAIGWDSLGDLTTGLWNTSIGTGAMSKITEGGRNVAIGNGAMYTSPTGSNNTAIGVSALEKSKGDNNVAIGLGSLWYGDGSGNVAIGYKAGFNETGSNKLYIENSDSNSPLIYGEFDTKKLKFNINNLNLSNLPTSSSGLVSGDVWNDNGVLKIV